jgi:hypothetical protein
LIEVESTDRVLLLSIPSSAEIAMLAGRLSRGILVCIADQDRTYELRQELSDRQNVMVVPVDPEGAIPWRDEFFTVAYAPHLAEPPAEILRVLAPAGRIYLASGSLTKR